MKTARQVKLRSGGAAGAVRGRKEKGRGSGI